VLFLFTTSLGRPNYDSNSILFTHPCSRESYNHVSTWLEDARTLASAGIVIVLVGNKSDLVDEREVTFMEASRFAQENSMWSSNFSLIP